VATTDLQEIETRVVQLIAAEGPLIGKELAEAMPDVPVLALWQACYRSRTFHVSHFASYYLRYDITREDQVRLSPSIRAISCLFPCLVCQASVIV
jgi:hypothetical protein